MIKNEEGYADPTYGGAYKTIRQEEKRKQDEAKEQTAAEEYGAGHSGIAERAAAKSW